MSKKRLGKEFYEYKCFLRRYASENQSELFTTGGIKHSELLVSVFLEYTEEIVRVYSYGFSPGFWTMDLAWTSLTGFLDNKYKKLMILVESSDYTECAPLNMMKTYIQKRNNNSIQVRQINDEGKRRMNEFFGNPHCHFMVFDHNKYRLEIDPDNCLSTSSFNDPEYSSVLIRLFDEAFNNSSLII